MKKICFSLMIFAVLLFSANVCAYYSLINYEGNTINSITMDVYIDKYGDAEITEVWNCTTKYNRLETLDNPHPARYFSHRYDGGTKIKNLSVTDEKGEQYKDITSSSFSDLQRKVKTNTYFDGEMISQTLEEFKNYSTVDDNTKYRNIVELKWAISETGEKTYTLNYKIYNFIKQFSDAQAIAKVLIPDNLSMTPIGNVAIIIYADEDFEEDSEVWVVGTNNYTVAVEDGKIKYNSNGKMGSTACIDLLVKLPVDKFMTTGKTTTSYDSYFNSFINKYAVHEEENTGEIEELPKKIKNEYTEFVESIDMIDVVMALIMALIALSFILSVFDLIRSLFFYSEDKE